MNSERSMATYKIVTVSKGTTLVDGEPHAPVYLSVDARCLVPGVYASVVTELPLSQSMHGQALSRGQYAVFWPMIDRDTPIYEKRALYFGPFLSQEKASDFVRMVSANATSADSWAPEIRRIRRGGSRGTRWNG